MFVASFTLAVTLAAAQKQPARAVAQPAQPAVMPAGRLAIGRKLNVIGVPPGGAAPGGRASIAIGGPGDEEILKAVKLGTTDNDLLDFFRKRTPPAPERDKIADIVKQLGSKDLGDRDRAQAHLIAIGQATVPLLRQTMNNVDENEASTRARLCLHNIEGANASLLVINAARLLASRKPSGACDVLIGYLPYAEDDTTYQEVEAALVAVAIRDGRPDPAIMAALKDRVALRRASAAQVLAQAGGTAHYAAIRPLLRDEKASVRLKAALGLVGAYDAEAIPVLIDLMGEGPSRMRSQAEDYLINLSGEWAVSGPRGNDATSRRLRRDVWAAWWKGVDASKIIADIKARTPSDEERDKVIELIAKLDDSVAEVREAASNDIIALGTRASSLLRRAINANTNPRITAFASKCLEAIEKDNPSPFPLAAPRILALRRPAGTVAALIGYLPFSESEELVNQIIDVLGTIGVTAGKGDEVLVKALTDKLPERRAAAGLALCQGKAALNRDDIRKLLRDKDTIVQLRAAQGLAEMGDRKSVPALIALLKDLPLDQCWEVEDYLGQVAGDKAPTEIVTADANSRTKAIEAWAKWWTENSKTVDLAKIDRASREMGYYLICENWSPFKPRGRVLEVDSTGKIRWEIEDLQYPYDAQILRGGRILIVEQQNRVTERDMKGKIVGLDRFIPNVFHVERLRDGSTFIACRNQLQIIDARGNAKFTHAYNMNTILAARHFRDGSMAYVSYSGHYVKLDRAGKQIKTFTLPWANNGYNLNGGEILPGDRVLASVMNLNKVMEFNADGKVVWEASVTFPSVPHRTRSGNTIVSSNSNQGMVELDRRGKVIKEWTNLSYRPYRVIKR
jgi:HEAT repeat protein